MARLGGWTIYDGQRGTFHRGFKGMLARMRPLVSIHVIQWLFLYVNQLNIDATHYTLPQKKCNFSEVAFLLGSSVGQ